MLDNDAGTAMLSGVVEHLYDSNKRWRVNISYSERSLEKPQANASAPEGETWFYYLHREGMLTGEGEYQGLSLKLVDNPNYEPSLQIGRGGNGVHPEYGARHEAYYHNPANPNIGIWSEWTMGLSCRDNPPQVGIPE
ncbi:MAG: hypothetical protein R2880_15345 [Deinococcales bacterium]